MEQSKVLRELFDRLDAAELRDMQARRQAEHLQLEFKTLEVTGEPSTDDIKNLRRAISGFANSTGGIVLWGVDSRSSTDPKDRHRFQDIRPIRDAGLAIARLQAAIAEATQPPCEGVVHSPIEVPGGSVVKTLIPASLGGPLRTNEQTGQYYRRYGDTFRPMQHFEIEDMFSRRVGARLALHRSPLFPRSPADAANLWAKLVMGIRNEGRGVCRFPRLELRSRNGSVKRAFYGLDGNGNDNLRQEFVSDQSRLVFCGGADDVIHPNCTLEVTKVAIYIGGVNSDPPIEFEYELSGANAVPVTGVVQLHESERIVG